MPVTAVATAGTHELYIDVFVTTPTVSMYVDVYVTQVPAPEPTTVVTAPDPATQMAWFAAFVPHVLPESQHN